MQRVGKSLVEGKTNQVEKCPSPTVDNIGKVIKQILEDEGFSHSPLPENIESE